MVTTPHAAATEAGARILRCGGNAIEAAIAAGAVLAVVYPHFCGLGGDGLWLVSDETGKTECIMGIGQATAHAAMLPDRLPLRGPLSAAGSAGLVRSWDTALALSRAHWDGTFRLAHLLDPAIEHASEGITPSPSLMHWLRFRQAEWPDWSGFAANFGIGAQGAAGTPFRQPALAESLRAIACDGPEEFYEGALARRIAAGLAGAGAPLDAADLAATIAPRDAPVGLDVAGMRLLAPPPPTQGVTTLAIMGILERLGIAGINPDDPQFYHLVAEAIKQAFLDRPHILTTPAPDLLAPQRLDAMAARIRQDDALEWPHPFQSGDTVFLAAVDARGRAVSLLQSIYFDWGSGIVAGDTGILWQNRAAAFNGLPGHPQRIQPGAWPFFTLNPGLALSGGRPALLYGTQGTDGQPQTLATVLSRAIMHGMSPAAALAGPRLLLGRGFADDADTLKIESSAGEATMAGLRTRGHQLSPIAPLNPLCGQAGLIAIDTTRLRGAHDPRSDGCAIGLE